MKILCNNCKHFFEVNPEKEGRVQYSKTKSIFRVELILKSPCPKCKTPLKVLSNEKQEHIGYPYEPTVSKKIQKPVPTPKTEVSATDETRIAIASEAETRIKEPSIQTKKEPTQTQAMEPKREPTIKKNITLEDRVRLKLQERLDSHHRYSVQSFKKPEALKKSRSKIVIPNLEKISHHASKPAVYLSLITLVGAVLMFTIMQSVFEEDEAATIASKEPPKMEESLEEFEPTHHDDSVGGPSYPSETDKKTGLEDETIKKMTSNLQILHLPPLRQVTSTYGIRLDPFTKKLAFHAGVDFKADTGTKIEAAMDGVVKSAGRKSMYGNAIVIKHDNGYETLYGHLSKMLVKQGDKIKQKDIIGLAGSTGRSTGPHLHFELIKNGKKIDPLSTDLLTIKKK